MLLLLASPAGLLLGAALAAGTPPACPEGARPHREATSTGSWHRCVRPDGTFHGPAAYVDAAGRIREAGSFEDGLRSGSWRGSYQGGEPAWQETWVAGLQVGSWTTWAPSGAVQGRGRAAPLELPADGLPVERGGAEGRLDWRLHPGGAAAGELVLVSDAAGALVLVPAPRHLLALEAATGAPAWLAPTEAVPLPGAAWDEGRLVLASAAGRVFEIDPARGQLRTVETGRETAALVGAGLGRALVWEAVGRLSAVDLQTGARAWGSADFYGPAVPVQLAGGDLLAARARSLRRLVQATGEAAWEQPLPARASALAEAGEQVFVLDARGQLLALDRTSGELLWALELDGARGLLQPVLRVEGGRLHVGGHRGWWTVDLAAVEVVGRDERLAPVEDRWGSVRAGVAEGVLSLELAGQAALELSLEGLSGRPLVLGEEILVRLADGSVLALDLVRALAEAETGLESVSLLDEEEAAFAGALLELQGGLSPQADPVAHFFSLEDQARPTWEGPAVVASEVEADGCVDTLVSLDLAPVEAWIRAAAGPGGVQPEAVRLELRDLVFPLPVDEEAPAFEPEADWQVLLRQDQELATWWHRWVPQVEEAWAFQRDEVASELLEATLACEADAVSYRGVLVLHDGQRRWRYEGSVLLEGDGRPSPWGAESCLVHAEVGGEALGWWSSGVGWVDLSLEDDAVAAPSAGAGGLGRVLEGGGELVLSGVGETEPLVLGLGPGSVLQVTRGPTGAELRVLGAVAPDDADSGEGSDGEDSEAGAGESGHDEAGPAEVVLEDLGAWAVPGLRPDPVDLPLRSRTWELGRDLAWPPASRWLPLGRWQECEVDEAGD